MIPKITDLRAMSQESTQAYLKAGFADPVAIVARQARFCKDRQKRTLVTVPDFLGYARLISTGNAGQIVAQSGAGSFLTSGFLAGTGMMAQVAKLARGDFWAGAEMLLRYDLAMLPRGWSGPVMLHSQLMDIALALNNERFIEKYFQLTRKYPLAGTHTQQVPAALSVFARLNLKPASIAFPWAQHDEETRTAIASASKSKWFEATAWLAEVDFYPSGFDIVTALNGENQIDISGAIISF